MCYLVKGVGHPFEKFFPHNFVKKEFLGLLNLSMGGIIGDIHKNV